MLQKSGKYFMTFATHLGSFSEPDCTQLQYHIVNIKTEVAVCPQKRNVSFYENMFLMRSKMVLRNGF
jgi:hypothetical protein